MFSKFLLKKVGIFVLIAFVFLIGTTEYSFASEENTLLKADRYYRNGNYDEAVKILQKFIENLRAIAKQKKNVAKAFYLLAKVYYTVGEDAEVDSNLKKVYETFPTFVKKENDLEFKKIVNKIRKEMGLKEIVKQPVKKVKKVRQRIPTKKVIHKEGKKKKKFPILLVVGGVIIVAALAILLLKKKKEEVFDIRGTWTVHSVLPKQSIYVDALDLSYDLTFSGKINSGNFTRADGGTGRYTVNGKEVNIVFDTFSNGVDWNLIGSFTSQDNMSGESIVKYGERTDSGTWNAQRTSPNNNFAKKSSTNENVQIQ